MKRQALSIVVVLAAAACSPNFESGKTQCSDKRECPSGFSCSDNGVSSVLYCYENKKLGCSSDTKFHCAQSGTCWAEPGACSTVVNCGTAASPDHKMCELSSYRPDCGSDRCIALTAGDGGLGGATGLGGVGGRTVPPGFGGAPGVGGTLGSGIRDGGSDLGAGGVGGTRDAGLEVGVPGTGGFIIAGTTGRGGAFGTGGVIGRGGVSGSGGLFATGGGTGTGLCSGTPVACEIQSRESNCQTESGCVWNPSTLSCSGTPWPCSTYTTSTWCGFNGCTWSGPLVCTPTPVTSYCSGLAQPGENACFLCLLNACCGPFTACTNDTTCASEGTGPLWNSYVDCVMSCCAGTCQVE